MTMSVSLGILVSAFPENPGICFGITTVGLFLGSLPFFLMSPGSLGARMTAVAVLTAVTICCFLLCGSNADNNPTEKGE